MYCLLRCTILSLDFGCIICCTALYGLLNCTVKVWGTVLYCTVCCTALYCIGHCTVRFAELYCTVWCIVMHCTVYNTFNCECFAQPPVTFVHVGQNFGSNSNCKGPLLVLQIVLQAVVSKISSFRSSCISLQNLNSLACNAL